MTKKKADRYGLATTVFLLVFCFLILIPILYTVSASFKSNQEIMAGGAHLLPQEFTWDNYSQAWKLAHFDRYTINSIFLSLCTVVLTILVTSMTAYVLQRSDFPGKKLIRAFLLSTMFVSAGTVTLYPILKIMVKLHLNNLPGLAIAETFQMGAANLFLCMGYMKTISKEIDEAAMIDGCSFFQIYWKMILPLSKPILATVGLMAFQHAWNDYLLPLVVTSGKSETYPLIVGLVSLKSAGGEAATQYNLMMAGTVFSILPIVLIYIIMNKQFIAGLTSGSVKG